MAAEDVNGGITIRTAVTGDVEPVRSCVIAAYSTYLSAMDRKPAPMLDNYEQLIKDGVVRVAEIDSQVMGAIVLWPREDHLYVDNIAVHPDAQGTGLGSFLLTVADDECRTAGLTEIRLYTNEIMGDNIPYYERRGFVETHRAIENGYRRIYFTRTLAPNQS